MRNGDFDYFSIFALKGCRKNGKKADGNFAICLKKRLFCYLLRGFFRALTIPPAAPPTVAARNMPGVIPPTMLAALVKDATTMVKQNITIPADSPMGRALEP